MHKAGFFEKDDKARVTCRLCGHQCRLEDGQAGRCRVRVNRQGQLYSVNYGRLAAANVDPVEKKPLYHFLPGHRSYSVAAAGCNFRCDFCQNWRISQAAASMPSFPYSAPQRVVDAALRSGCKSISYTYTEPVVFWEYVLECMQLARQAGLNNVAVSNGYGSPQAWQAAQGLLQAANIDLKAFSEDFYHKICGARLAVVLDSLRQLKSMGVWLEVTTLIIPGLNDNPAELRGLADFIAQELSPQTPWHISAYHPNYRRTSPAAGLVHLRQARAIGEAAGLQHIYMGNVLTAADTLCAACGRLLVERRGYSVREDNPAVCAACGWQPAGVWHE